jgi:hypothetical protein
MAPDNENLSDDAVNLTPEKYASFYSKLVFAWFDTLAIKGWKRTLKETDLWGLAHENK